MKAGKSLSLVAIEVTEIRMTLDMDFSCSHALVILFQWYRTVSQRSRLPFTYLRWICFDNCLF